MFVNTMPRYEILSEDAMDVLDRGWRRILTELGVEFLLPEAVELFRAAGQTVEGDNLVKLDPDFVLEQVAKAPRQFELEARNAPSAEGSSRDVLGSRVNVQSSGFQHRSRHGRHLINQSFQKSVSEPQT